MKYLGTAKVENEHVIMPDSFSAGNNPLTYKVVDIGGDILLTPTPFDRQRVERIGELARRSIDEHRDTLKGLAQ